MRFENNFNGIYFHHNFYRKTGVSRNGLSPGYSEQDTSSVKAIIRALAIILVNLIKSYQTYFTVSVFQ